MILIILSILSVLLPAAINTVNGISTQLETLYVWDKTSIELKYQVCQMVNRYIFIQFWYILEGLGIDLLKKIFYDQLLYLHTYVLFGHLFYCVTIGILYIWSFVIFSPFFKFVWRKIWQTLVHTGLGYPCPDGCTHTLTRAHDKILQRSNDHQRLKPPIINRSINHQGSNRSGADSVSNFEMSLH
jgi:hypothetical protein